VTLAMEPITIFVGGKLTNPLNGSLSRAHWSHKHKWSMGWKAATWNAVAQTEANPFHPCHVVIVAEVPKRVMFLAQTARVFDEDGLQAALKPIRDALMGWPPDAPTHWRVIHSDAPDSGHVFQYAQVVNRQERGVRITVETLT